MLSQHGNGDGWTLLRYDMTSIDLILLVVIEDVSRWKEIMRTSKVPKWMTAKSRRIQTVPEFSCTLI